MYRLALSDSTDYMSCWIVEDEGKMKAAFPFDLNSLCWNDRIQNFAQKTEIP